MALMNVDDEVSWKHVGLFAKADDLEGVPKELFPCTFTSSPAPGITINHFSDPSTSSLVAPPANEYS
jgi:hypothetical protein